MGKPKLGVGWGGGEGMKGCPLAKLLSSFSKAEAGQSEGSWVVRSSQGLKSRAPYSRDTWPTRVPNQASLKQVAAEARRPCYRCSKLSQEGLMLKERSQLMESRLRAGIMFIVVFHVPSTYLLN